MSKRSIPTLGSHVAGIPCGIKVTWYSPGTNCPITSASLEPNDPEDFDFKVLDRKGYPAPWLERKLTEDDIERILEEYKMQPRPVTRPCIGTNEQAANQKRRTT